MFSTQTGSNKRSSKANPPIMGHPHQTQQQPKKQQPRKKSNIIINFVAGAAGGTAGVFVTCPLDVVQTRLQSSLVNLKTSVGTGSGGAMVTARAPYSTTSSHLGLNVFNYMKYIIRTEGFPALYKGLVPNLIGIAPSRALYFGVYTKSKSFLSSTMLSDSSPTHMMSALTASWSVSTITNPIWFMKTRLQLDLTASGQRRKIKDVIKEVYQNEGIRGFYRGLSASYIGASETMIYFVIYEKLKTVIAGNKDSYDLAATDYVLAAFLSKCCATISVYPHEVVRTRLRQESSKVGTKKSYRGFLQTLRKVYKEEKWTGLYGGMGAHLMRQVPNTVIMFLTYEMIVNFFSSE